MGKKLQLFISTILVAGFVYFFNSQSVLAGSEHNVSGWAWSENIGWISFNNTSGGGAINYGVNIEANGVLSGYAWSEHIGWITFNEAELSGCPSSPCRAWVDYLGTREVFGWARALAYGGGWDGWIKLRGENYGVSIDTTVSPAQFRGWAWSDMVIGWISFNCSNQGVCGTSDYKVITTFFSLNQPPNKPGLPSEYPEGESWNHCEVQGLSIPTFHWTYSDPDGDPQLAYQVKIYGETTLDTGEISCPATCISYTPTYEWIKNNLNWGKTYSWQARVKDTKGNWSAWSDSNSFSMPSHAYPWPDFSPPPQNPGVGKLVNFTDNSKCYTSANVEYNCKDGANIQYAWDFNYIEAEGFTVDSTNKGNTTTTYNQPAPYKIRLRITDNSLTPPGICSTTRRITAILLPPEWKEVPPF